ncbi:mannose-P-dolichol utilization defect 1 protein [Flagelloscypha sp. PMI_526]|nr:mannose-P-dolichol utilization defect 1 protein [Flagelloscypha sp. PMI_526]
MATIELPAPLNLTFPVHPVILSAVEGIIGQKCTQSLLLELNVSDVECLKFSLSKGLGLGIVVGGSIMKLPQILAILASKSASGLSLPSSLLSTSSYMITAAYGFKSEFPFSTYGENLFLTVQDAIVTLLILAYAPKSSSVSVLTTAAALIGAAAFLYATDLRTLELLQVSTIPLSIGSKIPQIVSNYRNGNTGMLSGVVVWVQVFGTLARLFTTLSELSSPTIVGSFSAALVLNLVLAIQILIYGRGSPSVSERKDAPVLPQPKTIPETVRDVKSSRPGTPVSRSSTPVPGQQPSGRKWNRKLD